MKKFNVGNLFISLITLCFTCDFKAQDINKQAVVGLNLASLPVKTFDLKAELDIKPQLTCQLGTGLMYHNTKPGSLLKSYDGTFNWSNSGAFLSLGARYNTRKQFDKSAIFVGCKLISGYFEQQGLVSDLQTGNPESYESVTRSGFFAAVGFESGVVLKVAGRFLLDLGLQYSPQFYKHQQLSDRFSVLPGIGAIWDLQGIATVKYVIFRTSKQAPKPN